jgi:hypothetical protein
MTFLLPVSRPDLIVEMGQNARRLVEQEFNAEKHYERLLEIYGSVKK